MNNRFATIIFIALANLCLLASCVRESVEPVGLAEGEVVATLAFGTTPMDVVVTRAGHSLETESRVFNMHLFVFDKDGNKVASHFFSDDFKQEDENAELPIKWWCGSYKSGSFSGKMRLAVPSGSGMKLYLYTNLDSDMVRVSEELLSHSIQNEDDLIKFQCYLNQNIVSRNILFPMTGVLEGVTIDSKGNMTDREGNAAVIKLERIDAKIKFDFRTGNRSDDRGQKIKSFQALQWRVFNVPRTAYAINSDNDDSVVPAGTPLSEYSEHAKDFFDTEYVNFETYNDQTGEQSFTFYMLENRQSPKNPDGIKGYQDRSRQAKNPDGTNQSVHVSYVVDGKPYERDMRVFENANDFSTYVMVTGKVTMELENDDAGQVLSADVTYLIHLGDWGTEKIDPTGPGHWNDEYSKFDNFQVLRNTSYTYTVTVNSVNNIRVEVETSKGAVEDVKENQPGATGFVTIAREEIALCDAHYESKTLTFHLANFFDGGVSLGTDGRVQNADKCVADKLTWEVETPFSTGGPRVIDGIDITSGLDYKWVHFRLNKKDNTGNYLENRRKFLDPDILFESSSKYRDGKTARSSGGNQEGDGSEGLSGYHNDGVFDIVSLVKYMKEQVNKYLVDPATSDFDQGKDGNGNLNPKICVTAFVNEYYYEAHPLTGAKSTILWKKFVNQPDRSVHILCNSDISKDLESRATGSVVTIQQHAIQSVYNTDESYTSLQTAWGTEYTDEFSDKIKTYNVGDSKQCGGYNNSSSNGLANSLCEWDLANGYAVSPSFVSNVRWDNYMNFEVPNSTPQMKDDNQHMALRYLCMSRNRDNNGDGVIDGSEIRWYLAAEQQLIGLYVGDGLLNQNSRLYNRSLSQRKDPDVNIWRQHIISSTKNGSEPSIIWAEEGISTGALSGSTSHGGAMNSWSIRCVRNLGLDLPDNPKTKDITREPDPLAKRDGDGSASPYVVTCTNLNANALRYYTSRDLEYASNESEQNRLYKKFEVAPQNTSFGYSLSFVELNNKVNEAGSSAAAGFCPEGYRLPSQLELAMIRSYCGVNIVNNVPSRTYWSMGRVLHELKIEPNYGEKGKDDKKSGFISGANLYLSRDDKVSQARCVRDIRVD